MDELYNIIGIIKNKEILLALLPALFINILINYTNNLLVCNICNKKRKVLLGGILSFIGILFGLSYHFIHGMNLNDSLIYSLSITFLSYLFYKIDIYKLLQAIINKLAKRFTNNE